MKDAILSVLILFAAVAVAVFTGESVRSVQAAESPLCVLMDGVVVNEKAAPARYAALMYCDGEPGPVLRFVSKDFYAWVQQQHSDGYDAVVVKDKVK